MYVWGSKGWVQGQQEMGGVVVSIMRMGQSSNSIGPEWTGISTRVSTTTTASKDLYILNNDKPTRTPLRTMVQYTDTLTKMYVEEF